MIFLSILLFQIPFLLTQQGVGIELRLDLMERFTLEEVAHFLSETDLPILLTLRKASQGGGFQEGEEKQEEWIERLLSLEPEFFDLEWDMRESFIQEMISRYPKTKFILSFHDFEKVPSDAELELIYQKMRSFEAFTYKIAVKVTSTNEALKMLLFAKKHPNVSMIPMGESGQFARILGKVVGNVVAYAGGKTAPGQFTLEEMIDVYHYPLLNQNTKIYGLIGDPVEKSPGHFYHNGVFQKKGIDAVYVKMRVRPEELDEFIHLSQELGISGLSVTIPLKEKILPYIDWFDEGTQEIGAINTLRMEGGKIFGTNTDGKGALDAIEKKMGMRGKKVILLGAGGAARGIACEAKARGAEVFVLNRTVERAKELAEEIGCFFGSLEEIPAVYDCLINCTSELLPIDPAKIVEGSIAMDVVYFPKLTSFLKTAMDKQCQLVY